MGIPIALFEKTIRPRVIYKFKNDEFDDLTGHFHICINLDEQEILTLVICTSQFEKLQRHFKNRNLPPETLVWIRPDGDLPFKKDTYVDCNKYFIRSRNWIIDKYEKYELEGSWEIHESAYQQIVLGMIDSPIIENVIKNKLR